MVAHRTLALLLDWSLLFNFSYVKMKMLSFVAKKKILYIMPFDLLVILFFCNLMEDQDEIGNQVKFSWKVY
jgi:hypothetical protein